MKLAVERELRFDGLTLFQHASWHARFEGLVQGITGRNAAHFGPPDIPRSPNSRDGWTRLMEATGMDRIVRCRQVHGAEVVTWAGDAAPGVRVVAEADALVTSACGVLLAVTVADCVPVFLVEPERRLLGLAHAGWRGAAAGVVPATVREMRVQGAESGSLHVHLGPAICGACYEVGPEVPAALGGWPEDARHVDLRDHIVTTLSGLGVPTQRISRSPLCTRCQNDRLLSYRGGDQGQRMCAFLGWVSR